MSHTEPQATVAIDAGQTGIKVRVERPGAAPVEHVLTGVRTDRLLLPQLVAATRQVAEGVGVGILSVGASGLTDAEADAGALIAALADVDPARVVLAHDSITSFLGALGDDRGVVVAAGTGVVALAVGPTDVARVDGWGYLMGDAGSGFWIGRQALDAVMRAHDGRGPATALTDPVRARWSDLETAYIDLQADPARVSVVASFAAVVAALADEDAVAAGICRAAAEELALSAATALDRVGAHDDDAPQICAIGGVPACDLIRTTFVTAMRRTHPAARFVQPRGSGLDGAAALARLDAQHPLHRLVSEAARP